MAGIKVNALPLETNPLITDSTINDSGNVTTKRTTWQSVFNMFFSSLPASGISAAGTNQATATILTKEINRIDTVGVGTGVIDNAAPTVGFKRTVQNNGANDLLYYPFLGKRFYVIGAGLMAVNAPITIGSGNQVSVICYNANETTLI